MKPIIEVAWDIYREKAAAYGQEIPDWAHAPDWMIEAFTAACDYLSCFEGRPTA